MNTTGSTMSIFDDDEEEEYKNRLYDYKFEGMNTIWETKDGKYIQLKDMKDSHIKNIINMITENRSRHSKAWIEILQDVVVKRRFEKIDKIKNIIKQNK